MKRFKFLLFIMLVCLLTGCSSESIMDFMTYNPFDKSVKEDSIEDTILETEIDNYGNLDFDNVDENIDISKDMDITRNKEIFKETYINTYGNNETTGYYEKPIWDYIPDNYDLSQDIFSATNNYAGKEKYYNNDMYQTVLSNGLTTGQTDDIQELYTIAETFVYEEYKDKYTWTADLEELCDRVYKVVPNVYLYSKTSSRPVFHAADNEWVRPCFMNANFDSSIIGYDDIGIPIKGDFTVYITVWDPYGPVGWKNDFTGEWLNEDEVFENMGAWEFDDLKKSYVENNSNAKVENNYIYTDDGCLYYYDNGISVTISCFDETVGLDTLLEYCEYICK